MKTPPNTRPSFFRRKFLIHKKFQLELISYFLVFYFSVIFLLYLTLKFSFESGYEEIVRLISPADLTTINLYYENQLGVLNWAFLIFSVVGSIFAFYGGLRISHRAVGPIYRLRMLLREASAGELVSKIQSRKDDYFPEIFIELENYINKMNSSKKN